MEFQNNIKMDQNLAYFIGVLHSDGCIYIFNDKKKDKLSIRLNLTIADKSLEMAKRFKQILLYYFNRNVNIRKSNNNGLNVIQTSINQIWSIVQHWQKGQIPHEIRGDKVLFGAYLGGLIDGDGHIKLKNNTKDRVIPQCVIRISSDRQLDEVSYLVERYLACKVHFEHDRRGKGVDTCFYVSKKNVEFIESFISPYIFINHKKERLSNYILKKRAYPDSNRN